MRQLKLTVESHAKEENLKHEPEMENEFESCGSPRHRKVTARWNPDLSNYCRPKLGEAPVFYPTVEEFEDTLGYLAKIRPRAEPYGICRIVPPACWVPPPCLLKDKNLWENATFPTRIQQIDLLQNRKPMKKKSKAKKQKCKSLSTIGKGSKKTAKSGSIANVASEPEPDEKFGFQPGSDFTLKDFEQYANIFKDSYFGLNDANENGKVSDNNHQRWEPSVEEIEGEYWRIVEQSADEVKVYYGADLETGALRCGFPKTSSSTETGSDRRAMSGWNLNTLARLPGSALRFEESSISGVQVPWMYIGMCFSTFCWHVEDHHLYSINYVHWGDPKVWYGVPGSHASALENAMKTYLPALFEEQPNLLNELVTLLSPTIFKFDGVPVYRTVQHLGEFVITFPRAYHCGFNSGFNCAEAVNVAPVDWFVHGQDAVELYSFQCRKTSLSHDKLLFECAREAVHALAELTLNGKENLKCLQWTSACGKDGVLTNSLKTRIAVEKERLDGLPSHLKTLMMQSDFVERECFFCFYDLHLSAVGCKCSPDSYSCLKHSNVFCPCEMDKRFLLFRYTMDDLNTLVKALEGEPHAIEVCANRNTGTISVNAEDAFVYKQDYKRAMSPIRNYEEAKGSTYCARSNKKSNSNLSSSSNCHACSEIDPSEFHHETFSAPDGTKDCCKLLGVAKQMRSDSREKLKGKFKMGGVETSNERKSVTNQSILIQKFGISVEPITIRLGSIMYGRKRWCNKHAIYPKGFKSHVKFFNFVDPAKICDYVCEISDAGFRGPLFKVTKEGYPRLAFTNTSADKCWETILDRLTREIKKRWGRHERGLPSLKLLQGINGHKMFGFLSTSIIQAIEAKDPKHQCIEYWSHKESVPESSGARG